MPLDCGFQVVMLAMRLADSRQQARSYKAACRNDAQDVVMAIPTSQPRMLGLRKWLSFPRVD